MAVPTRRILSVGSCAPLNYIYNVHGLLFVWTNNKKTTSLNKKKQKQVARFGECDKNVIEGVHNKAKHKCLML